MTGWLALTAVVGLLIWWKVRKELRITSVVPPTPPPAPWNPCKAWDYALGTAQSAVSYKVQCDLAQGHAGYHQYTFTWSRSPWPEEVA